MRRRIETLKRFDWNFPRPNEYLTTSASKAVVRAVMYGEMYVYDSLLLMGKCNQFALRLRVIKIAKGGAFSMLFSKDVMVYGNRKE